MDGEEKNCVFYPAEHPDRLWMKIIFVPFIEKIVFVKRKASG